MNPDSRLLKFQCVFVAALFCIFASVSGLYAAPHELLYLDFNNPSDLGAQTGLTADGNVYGDMASVQSATGEADFGDTGRIQFPGFVSPSNSFSIEARFNLHDYAPVTTRYLSDIINTATWSTGFHQGFTFRTGGGYDYPLLPSSAYTSDTEYQMSNYYYSNTDIAFFSRCLGDFDVGTYQETPAPVWKDAYSDVCIYPNRWTYMVGTWDGKNLRIFLDGREVTDTLRINGADLPPRLDSAADLTIGARDLEDYDSRHHNGLMDFVRIVDIAMSPEEIEARYEKTLTDSIKTCHTVVIPVYPSGGRCQRKEDQFRVGLVGEGDCSSGSPVLNKGDSIEVQLSKDPIFQNVFLDISEADTVFTIDSSFFNGKDSLAGPVYWRTQLKPASNALAKASAVTTDDWSLSAPMMLDMNSNTSSLSERSKIQRVAIQVGQQLFLPQSKYPLMPKLYAITGKILPQALMACPGGWCSETSKMPLNGVFFIK